ncbi:hypothetical protein J5N97_004665 [Dioscorea zingiberensis]|uniref:BURP domain-containing protein n=1 Tax=Dioscorea zingiberensis TaxID=325984 RepID=A0A9D5D7Q8_9LILI|nr:hypothetical protein J5N97_004665 [Dioscorea zingiberensis]
MNNFPSVLVLILITATPSHAILPPKVYWNIMLPNSPMPNAILDLLSSDGLVDEKTGTAVNVGKGGIGVNVNGKDNTHVGVAKGGITVNTGKHRGSGTNVNVGHGGVGVNVKGKGNIQVGVGKGGVGVEPSSVEAEAMKNTLADCEEPAMRGESKFCTTSLESMVEFSMLSLGTRDVQAISTTVSESRDGAEKQQYYSVAPPGAQAMAGEKLVACHAQPYRYAVFYCHATSKSKAYKVPLVGKDGTKVEAMAVCHLDTSAWNPKYLAFQVLKVKPGTVPVCHFLPQDHVVWSVRK